MNTTLPYKFGLVLPKLEGIFQWNRFYSVKEPCVNAQLGTILVGNLKTYRVDIGYEYFKADKAHWKNKKIKDLVRTKFNGLDFKYLNNGCTIVMVWTNDLSWLADKTVQESIEGWNGDLKEPEFVWATVRTAGVARQQGNEGQHHS